MTEPLTNDHPSLAAAWHPVARVAELGDRPTKVRLLGEDWVLVRLDGELAAFRDLCPHRLAPLSAGRVDRTDAGEVLRCGYHGWCFEASGACTGIPALGPGAKLPPRSRATTPHAVAEHLGLVWLAPEAPRTPLPPPPVAVDEPGFLRGDLHVPERRGGAGLLIDNFLDMAHFPFVHAATIGSAEAEEIGPLDIQRDGYTMTVRAEHPFPNREDPGVADGTRPLLQTRRVTYRYTAPFSISLRIDYVEAGGTNVIEFFVQPVDHERVRIFTSVLRNDLDGDLDRLADAVAFEEKIVGEDLDFQEHFRQVTLPLDLTAEVHTKADRMTVELRRILAEWVATAEAPTPDDPELRPEVVTPVSEPAGASAP